MDVAQCSMRPAAQCFDRILEQVSVSLLNAADIVQLLGSICAQRIDDMHVTILVSREAHVFDPVLVVRRRERSIWRSGRATVYSYR